MELLEIWCPVLPVAGAKVRKSFGNQGVFHGEVIEYDSQRDLYRIQYTDDGEEELTLTELLLILTETPHLQVT